MIQTADDIRYIDISLHGTDIHTNILTSELELFLQEIELSIKILPHEVWGMENHLDLKRYIFNQYVTITQIRNEITNFINKHCYHASLFTYKISVETIKNPNGGSDLIYIVFTIVAADITRISQDYLAKFLIG